MGAIKDLVDLVNQLVENAQDRKVAAELREVQQMIGSIQSEHAVLHEQNINLMTENAELKSKIAKLEQRLTQPEQQEILALKGEFNRLKELVSFSKTLEFREPFYFATNELVPYCPNCWESEKKAIHLVCPDKTGSVQKHDCPNCKQYYFAGL